MVHTKDHHPSSTSTTTTTSNSSADFELLSLKPASYTSLRDILPSTPAVVQSPKVSSSAVRSGYEIPIRNRLVKQAAWAYLRPMSTSPDSGGSTIFHRLWNRFSDACLRLVTQIFDCLLQSTIQLRTTTSRL
ncbi:uncharacterized protein LOC112516487 [Cynara cardunculus var. scolymus]|nr:uncharacterized protein LOC112516487 [Cynara cardunculus var. scolymus]